MVLSGTSGWHSLLTWVGVPRRLPVSAEHLPTWHTCGAASPELIPMTLLMNVHVPQTQGDTQWIFSLKEIAWTICLSYFLERISAFLKACLVFRIFPCPTGVSSFPQTCVSWASAQSPPDQFCRLWKWGRDCFSKIQFPHNSFHSRTEPQADTSNWLTVLNKLQTPESCIILMLLQKNQLQENWYGLLRQNDISTIQFRLNAPFWNACWEPLRYIGAFYLIPQLKCGTNDCTKYFFPKNSSEKLIRYIPFTAMGTTCYRTMKILLHFQHYSLCNSKQIFFLFSLSFLYQHCNL